MLRPGDPDNYFDSSTWYPALFGQRWLAGACWWRIGTSSTRRRREIRVVAWRSGSLARRRRKPSARARLGELGVDEPLLVLNDEGHHAYRPAPVREGEALTAEERRAQEATVWVSARPHQRSLRWQAFSVDPVGHAVLPARQRVPGRIAFPWIVSDFRAGGCHRKRHHEDSAAAGGGQHGPPGAPVPKLWQHVTANLASGERLPGGKPKPEVVFRKAEAALLTLAGQWAGRLKQIEEAAPGRTGRRWC